MVYSHEHYLKHKDCFIRATRKWQLRHAKQRKKYVEKYLVKNRDRILAWHKKYRERNKIALREYACSYRKRNKRVIRAKARAKYLELKRLRELRSLNEGGLC
jgi:hypothetical protein